MAYFPMFVDITDKNCLVVGGGVVAYRKVKLLLDFCAKVEVVALEVCQEIDALPVVIKRREFLDSDLEARTLVIAATDNQECNHRISVLCREQNIPVNVVDQKEDCSFIVPSYVKEQDVVAAFSSGGKSPVLTQYLKEIEKAYLTPVLGEINAYLGEKRETVKTLFDTEAERKAAYQRLFSFALHENRVPTEQEFDILIKNT